MLQYSINYSQVSVTYKGCYIIVPIQHFQNVSNMQGFFDFLLALPEGTLKDGVRTLVVDMMLGRVQ